MPHHDVHIPDTSWLKLANEPLHVVSSAIQAYRFRLAYILTIVHVGHMLDTVNKDAVCSVMLAAVEPTSRAPFREGGSVILAGWLQ